LRPGETFLDLCAAPGSKTTQIAAMPDAASSLIVAGDLYAARARLLRETCQRQNLSRVAVVQYDATAGLPFGDGTFDAVLVDAPCSGTGTLGHNPEIRYLLSESDIAELAAKQLTILLSASKLVKRGGRLIYSTCSLERDENEDVSEQFLTQSEGFRSVPPAVDQRFATAEGFAQTLPGRDAADGFFIAVFEKN
jgi:16S rRNA (cytosine967-C5)-methyltransferase